MAVKPADISWAGGADNTPALVMLKLSSAGADNLPRGVLVGTVELYDCVPALGGFAWLLQRPFRFKTPQATAARPMPVWFYVMSRSQTK